MATSFVQASLMERDENHQNMVLGEEETTRSEVTTTTKQKGGKNGKVSRKKQPQRGLGVEKLERLRLQERWKLMTEIDQSVTVTSPNLQNPFPFQFPVTYYDPKNRLPVPYNGFAPVSYLTDGQTSFGFSPYPFNNTGYDVGVPFPVSMVENEARFQNMNPFEPSKELSSIQNVSCLFDHCDVCLEKKSEMMNGRDALGLSLGRKKTIDGEMKTVEEGVEVMAVHRKRNGGRGGGESVLMEYEFFPHKACYNKDSSGSVSVSVSDSEKTRMAVGEASPSSSTKNADFLDLSLKLSCYT